MPPPGPPITSEDGALAHFSVTIENGIVTTAEYRCTTCATLVALCELLRQRAAQQPINAIASWQPNDVRAWLPEIPPSRWSRIEVALRALQAAADPKRLLPSFA